MPERTSQPWIEVEVRVPRRLIETVRGILSRFSEPSFSEKLPRMTGLHPVRGAIRRDHRADALLGKIERAIRDVEQKQGLSQPLAIDLSVADAQEGSRSSMKEPPPVQVGSRLVLAAPSETVRPQDNNLVLFIHARQAFGDGGHPSTRLALRLMEGLFAGDYGTPPPSGWGLDAGCGSGILALAATGLWPGKVLAVDISSEAIKEARANRQCNVKQGSRVFLALGGLSSCRGPFSVVLANLVPSVHVDAWKSLWESLHSGGWLLLAGFSEGQKQLVAEPYIRSGGKEKAFLLDQGWGGLLLQKP